MAAAARFWDARRKSGEALASALVSMFAPSLVRQLLSRAGSRAGGIYWCAVRRLVDSRTALASVVVPLAGLLLHRNVLCRSSIAGLGIHTQLLVKKG
jgi:hypothetical protein